MTPFHDDGQAQFYLGDVREVLRTLPAESVHTVVTSPPYWSLRDYGIAPSVWGGDGYCRHEDFPNWAIAGIGPECWVDNVCRRCGAWRGALGLEPTPALFIAHLVDVMREVRRVLRPDGTAWVNMGDSFAGGGPHHGDKNLGKSGTNQGSRTGTDRLAGMKAKDKCLIPHRMGIALQDDGWWVRMDVIWAKPNPMPESVTDRPTQAHEFLWLLSKSERYYYDADAIREPAEGWKGSEFDDGKNAIVHPDVGKKRRTPREGIDTRGGGQGCGEMAYPVASRNKRSVWSIPTAPYAEAHFATFPPTLVKPCILAGCPEGGVVLDPFIGSGTTAMVAKSLGRRAIGIDLNPEYLEMAKRRCAQMGLII